MYKYVKRFIDIVLGIFILLLIWPIIVVIYIILKIDLDGKIIFKQERLGLNMKPFTIYKFKSMLDDTSLSHDERITKCSFVIRRSGMDELPNLFNIIKGDMSFVGPRALMAVDKTMPKEFLNPKRYTVKPGVFGLAQYHGRRNITNSRKLKYDLEYADRECFSLDFKLFFLSIFEVIGEMISYVKKSK